MKSSFSYGSPMAFSSTIPRIISGEGVFSMIRRGTSRKKSMEEQELFYGQVLVIESSLQTRRRG
jgi:hypothetical protein